MKIKKILLPTIALFISSIFISSCAFINNDVETKRLDLSVSSNGNDFALLDTYYREDQSFVYTADLHFRSGQAGGLAFGSKEDNYYYVINMDRYENRVKLIYFYKNNEGGYSDTVLRNDYFIGNDKITEHELALVNPRVRDIENVNLKVILTRENNHAYVDLYVEGIKRFGIDSIIDLNDLGTPFSYEGGYLGMNCFDSDVYLDNINIGESDFSYFSEAYRNQYHLQPYTKWSNDPNGLCYYNGYYHVFYQTHPFSNYWGDMYWGHARSTDLIHFEYLPICLFPETSSMGFGDGDGFMWSGCALAYSYGMSNDIDSQNWFPNGNGNGLIAYYTRAGARQDQVLITSDDEGLTWTKRQTVIYSSITGHDDFIDFRDPKVFPVQKDNLGNVTLWGMSLSSMSSNKGWFLKSTNLLDWSLAGSFNLPTPECIGIGYIKDEYDNEFAYLTNKSRSYLLGSIHYYGGDIIFEDENGVDISNYSLEQINQRLKPLDFGPDSYASQSFYISSPDSDYYGEEIVLNWFSGDLNASYCTGPGEYASLRGRWNGGFTIPVQYSVATTYDGLRIAQKPITVNNSHLDKEEIVNNMGETITSSSDNPLKYVDTHIFELIADVTPNNNSDIVFKVDIGSNEYMEFGWNATDGYYVDRTHLDDKGININTDWHAKYATHILGDSSNKTFYVLSDNGGLEVFCEDYSITFYFVTTAASTSTGASLTGDNVTINELVVNDIKSAYQKPITPDRRYIKMTASAFSNWDATAGEFATRNATYWNEGYSFHALDTFFRGEIGSSSSTSLMLNKWTQNTQYVYFTWGGARDDVNFLKIYYGNNNEYVSTMYNDTCLGNAMMLRTFKIPDDRYATLMNKYPGGFDMKIELIDNRAGIDGYGFHNFGYLHINQTLEETSNAMYYYLNCLDENRSEIDVRNIQAHYFTNASLNSIFYSERTSINDDFESQNDFEHNWYFDRTYYSDSQHVSRHLGTAISQGTFRPGNSRMPFNKSGDAFFRGWYESGKDSGFIEGDTAIYRFISHPFTLTGDCLVSIKMAGTASLHVIDSSINPNNNQAADIAWIDNRAYSTSGDEILTNNFNTCTMVRHIISLRAFEGRTIQLAIADISSGGWGAAYFDELKVNLNLQQEGFKIDSVTQNHKNGNNYQQIYLDKYINSLDINVDSNGVKYADSNYSLSDNSNAKLAYQYINDYLGYARSNNGQANICDDNIRKSNDMKVLLTTYDNLSEDVKRIVCASNDYQRERSGDWFVSNISVFNLGESIQGLAFDNNMVVTTYSVSTAVINEEIDGQINLAAITVIVISILSLSAYLFLKRKQQ